MSTCHNHSGEAAAAGTCRACLREFCDDCLVYAFGTGRQPYCVDCAVARTSTNGAARAIEPRVVRASGS